eukprot:2126276-Amphidinium_carterae.1
MAGLLSGVRNAKRLSQYCILCSIILTRKHVYATTSSLPILTNVQPLDELDDRRKQVQLQCPWQASKAHRRYLRELDRHGTCTDI